MKNGLMKEVEFGKRQGLSDETRQTLPQGVEPMLNVIGFATVFATDRLSAPDPLVGFFEHKRPQFIQFKHIIQLNGSQRRFQWGQVFGPVLNPFGDGAPRYTTQAVDTAQTDAFKHGVFHLSTGALIISVLDVRRAIALAGSTVVFLVASGSCPFLTRFSLPYLEHVCVTDE